MIFSRILSHTQLLFLLMLSAISVAQASSDLREEVVRFKLGTEHTEIKAKIRGRETVDYLLQARQGQKLAVRLQSRNRFTFFNLLPPASEDAIFFGSSALDPQHFEIRLNKDGVYRIRLYLMRNAARRNESANYLLNIHLQSASTESVQDRLGYPTQLKRGNEPFAEKLGLLGINFNVTCANSVASNELLIESSGLQIDNTPIRRKIDGVCTGAEVADLNIDGSPEVYVYINTRDSAANGSLLAFAANRRKSLSEIYLTSLEDGKDLLAGYQGHDEFAVVENTLIRRFPRYQNGDSDEKPSGGMRQLQYKLVPGEASWLLKLDRTIDF